MGARGGALRAAALALPLALAAPAAAGACRLALVLGLDVSGSVNAREYAIQLDGLARALRTEAVQDALLAVPGAPVAAYAFEWSDADHQAPIAAWAMLDTPERIDAFAARLSAHRRSRSEGRTAVDAALSHAARSLAVAPACARQVIDLSGDGANNVAVEPDPLRARLAGTTINALVIEGATPDPVAYYRSQVIQGPGAFVARARDFDDYPSVIVGKLLREIEDRAVIGALR